jgi:hypothetical protein
MTNRKIRILAAVATLTVVLAFTEARAQTTSVFSVGLNAPVKIIITPLGNLLVAENGFVANAGRVSVIDKFGNRKTVLDGLPAGISAEGGEISGPSGLELQGRTLFVVIGEGDGTLLGPIPGTLIPNPNPSSPILSSVLSVHFSASVEKEPNGFSLTLADHATLAGGGVVTLTNANGEKITVELITDFPNYVPDPLPFFPDNVQHSNPFGIASAGKYLYVVDGGQNSVKRVNAQSGGVQTLVTFPPRPNPLPFGPPVIDAVPDSIRVVGDQLLVPLLTGFPFVPGLSEIKSVDRTTGDYTTLIGGRSSAIDVVPGKKASGFYVLEFSTDFLANAPGQLLFFNSTAAVPTVVAGALITPTNVARDRKSGALFVTELATGRVMRVDP